MSRVTENCRERLHACLAEAERLRDCLERLEREEVRNRPAGFGADIPVTLDEDTAWASL